MDEKIKKQSKFFEFVNHSINDEHKISHAYLLETNGNNDYMPVLKEFIKMILYVDHEDSKEFISHAIDTDNYPDIKYINPDGYWIKKEQLLQLEDQYSKKSMLDNKLIYVIDSAESLNDSSANTILKFLEEPPENIIAILVASNRFRVLETVVSRCQILSLDVEEDDDTQYDEFIVQFVNGLKSPDNLLIEFDYYLKNIFYDKNAIFKNLEILETLLFKILRSNLVNSDKFLDFNLDFEPVLLSNLLSVIEKNKENVQFNLNSKLWFHNFIIELMEVIYGV